MARIRTIKPEFWMDDLIGALKRDQRLLFIATWNIADDEGLLRWSAPFLKGAVFPFDDDISVRDVTTMMDVLVTAGVVFPYSAGHSQQRLAYIVNFLKHQKINRPSPSRLPPPPVGDQKTIGMYGARDGWVCHLCLGEIDLGFSTKYQNDFTCSPDHVVPISRHGSDYPSNIKAAHVTCNKGRRERSVEEHRETIMKGKTAAQVTFPERFTHLSLNDSVTSSVIDSAQEREGEHEREMEGKRKGKRKTETVDSHSLRSCVSSGEDERIPTIVGFALETEEPIPKSAGPEALAFEAYNAAAKECGWPIAQRVGAQRIKQIRARFKDCGGLEGWQEAMRRASKSPFLRGEGRDEAHAGWRPDLDFFLQAKSFTRLMEGKYDGNPNGKAANGNAFAAACERQIRESFEASGQAGNHSPLAAASAVLCPPAIEPGGGKYKT